MTVDHTRRITLNLEKEVNNQVLIKNHHRGSVPVVAFPRPPAAVCSVLCSGVHHKVLNYVRCKIYFSLCEFFKMFGS